MATKKEIMLQLLKGVSWSDTARSLRCSKATVAKCAAKVEEEGIDPAGLEAMTDAEVSGLFADGRGRRGEEYLEPDYARVCDRLARVPKTTLALQWARHTDCNPGGKRLYGYSGFCRRVGEYARAHDLVARVAHEPGRTTLVDRAGLTAPVFDPVTGRRSPAHLFVASFPWSSWVYAECFPDMRTRSWIAARVHALQAAGGVPDILVPDNCATATDRRRKSGPVKVNGSYLEMAEHYGCAVVPARVRRPRDKASAEKAVDLCETWVLAPLADERFTSLEELNAEAGRLVDALNARPFSRREGCRDDALFGEGRAALDPLPDTPLEWCGWRRCKVSPDHHVQCDRMRYSVPHRLVGRTVDVRLGASTVTVLDGGETVAEHRRLRGRRGQCSPDPAHMPPEHVEAQSPWTRAWFERRAGEVGPEAKRLIGSVLDAHPVEEQGYVPRSNILSPSKRGRAAELEAACARVNAAGGAASCTRVKNTMAALGAEAPAAAAPPAAPADRAAHAGSVRGADHYRRKRGGPMLSEEDFAPFTRWRVGAFGRKLREVCDDEAYDDMTFEDKIGMCIDAEVEARDSGRIDKAVRTARFKLEGACAEDVYHLPDRSVTRDRIARLATCAWIGARENLVIISEGGGGKSCIAQALGVAACRKLMPVRYARLNDMFRELNVARSEGRVYDAPDRFAKPDPLILDDFFTTPTENPLNAVDLFEMLEAREGRGSTMFASQLEPDQWYLRISSELCADSILSRAVEHARVLDIKGPNMREYTAGLKAEADRGYWD